MPSELPPELAALIAQAVEASDRAYVPYSGFRVGAALRVAGGEVIRGCNVENASYGLTICAERVAVATAVAAGHREFEAIAIHVDGPDGQPCGACRQVLAELAPGVVVVYRSGGAYVVSSTGQLLPDGFGPAALDRTPA